MGFGLAACGPLRLFATSDICANTVSVRRLWMEVGRPGGGGALLSTLGDASFQFVDCRRGYRSGLLAFGDGPEHLLFVTDAGHDSVHMIDVVRRQHVGYMGGAGAVVGPRGVAVRGRHVAVSCWRDVPGQQHVVQLYEGVGDAWVLLRTMGAGDGGISAPGRLRRPYGLRISADGRAVVVASAGPISVFALADGSFVQDVMTGLKYPLDVEDVEEYRGGLLVGSAAGLASVPGLGVLRRTENCVEVWAPRKAIAMGAMSEARVAWMAVCSRLTRCKEAAENGVNTPTPTPPPPSFRVKCK